MAQRATNKRPPSTTTVWKTTRIRKRPAGPAGTVAKGARWSSRSKVNPRDRLTISIGFRGGAECWYEVHARGASGYFHGATALHDVVSEITQGGEYFAKESKAYEAPPADAE